MPVAIEGLERTLQLAYKRLGIYAKTFNPEAFSANFSILHKQMLQLLDGDDQLVAIAAPRGLGKTTTVRALVERSILYRDYEFIPYVSNSESVASLQTENIKRNLRTNREIRKIFGDVQINTDDPEFDDSFSKKAWSAFGNTLVLPRGAHQQIRGLLYKIHRPQLIIVDDLEKKEELENPENRRKLKEWFFSDLMKCIDRYSNKWRIIYIDTLKHHDSLLQVLLDSSEWKSIRLDLCDDDFNSAVPELISTEELLVEMEAHREKGLLDVFYMEYRNLPIAKETAAFKQEHFKYYDERDLDFSKLENIIIVDPAKTPNLKSADSCIMGVGLDYESNAIYIRYVTSGKMYPDELYEEMFRMRQAINAHIVGVEVTGLEEFIKQPITNEVQRRGVEDMCELVWLKARGGDPSGDKGKIKRIGALSPYYRQGFIYHNKDQTRKLEGQLIDFPRSKLLDCADCEGYILEMLELGQRYFTTPDEDPNDLEAEYAGLDYDEPLGDDYRRF